MTLPFPECLDRLGDALRLASNCFGQLLLPTGLGIERPILSSQVETRHAVSCGNRCRAYPPVQFIKSTVML